MNDATPEQRRVAFAGWLERVFADVRLTRGWSVMRIADETGVGKSTLYRWRDADWSAGAPRPDKVMQLCRGLNIDPAPAFRILGWGSDEPRRRATEPLSLDNDPDLRALARKLRDPSVPDSEKLHIRELVRYLANRPPVEDVPRKRQTS